MSPGGEINLSVVVITKDEQRNLPGFLASFLPVADEIVVIDDGSTDDTMAIAGAAGPKVRFIPSPRSSEEGFCDQRQKGVHAARGRWLLQVDTDMRLTPELAREILSSISTETNAAYRFRLAQYFMNTPVRWGGFQYWNQMWLSQRTLTRWTQRVHERIHIDAPDSAVGQLSHKMVHLNDISFQERLQKNRLYSTLEVERLLALGETFPLWRLFAMPTWRFIRAYFLMFGILDGRMGFIWALYQFTSTTTVYFLGWSICRGGSRSELEARLRAHMEQFALADGRPAN